ncbi:MAG TPA: carboxypeptidase-like regulatory domain-containing protein, partial [Gemmatimonadaceae bacterium]|nr:carboxypeptidase-like regulatory domain-containing protein [Gemmatimonadaceae bacterium]
MKWRALARSLRVPFIFAALSFAPTLLFAQAQATTGVIRGTATDSSGNPVSAFVTVRNTETNYTRTVKASDAGVFVTTLLPLGTYTVSARAVGYSPTQKSS